MNAQKHALRFTELLEYTEAETDHWRRWISTQPPEVLDLPIGTGRTATVRGLIHHIIVVESRYINRLRGEPVMEYTSVPADPIETTFDVFTAARRKLDEWLASATEADLAKRLEFQTISAGMQHASARKVLAHLLIHGMRHWAQIATVVRAHGYPTDWFHDILMSDALE